MDLGHGNFWGSDMVWFIESINEVYNSWGVNNIGKRQYQGKYSGDVNHN